MGITTDPQDPRLTRGVDTTPREQAEAYLVLSPEERTRGFLQPVRQTYRHVGVRTQLVDDAGAPSHVVRTGGCGALTHMGLAIAETYARDPWFYGGTYCVWCRMHRPLAEFVWDGDGAEMAPAEWSDAQRAEVTRRIVARDAADGKE